MVERLCVDCKRMLAVIAFYRWGPKVASRCMRCDNANRAARMRGERPGGAPERACRKCGKPGHYARTCHA